MRWDLAYIGRICAGKTRGDAVVTSIGIDSRTVAPGCLFIAVRGENRDGHEFIEASFAAGAVAAMTVAGRLGDRVGVEVDDTLEALRALGEARRTEFECPVIGVTGSSGKTTTKDLIASVLGPGTHASSRSFNNEFGVPLTLLSAPDEATALVVEVGSRGSGHISHLGSAIRPDVAVITNVGIAHLETFGSLEGVIDAKWELVETLSNHGVAVLPANDERLISRATGATVTFGEDQDADVSARDVVIDETGRTRFDLWSMGERVSVRMPVPGLHQPLNAAAAVAAAMAVGRPFADIAGLLETASVSPWRMESASIPLGDGEIVVVNDAYNANPDSMASALHTVVAVPGRHIAVLGKMHELGSYEAQAHRDAGALAASLGFLVFAVGDDPGIAEGAGRAATSVADVDAALERLRATIVPGDVILIKASRAAGLEAVAVGLEGGAA